MYRIIILSIICCAPVLLWSQSDFQVYQSYRIPDEAISFQMGHRLHNDKTIMHDGRSKLFYEVKEATKETMKKDHPVNMVIRVLGEDGLLKNEIEVPYNDIEIDLSGFAAHFMGKEKLLVFTTGRYRFYILNLSNYDLGGPFESNLEGIASDSQDGTLSFIGFFNNGEYLLASARNFGVFCYSLRKIDKPIPLNHICDDEIHVHPGYLFIDRDLDDEFAGIVVRNCISGNCDPPEYLFQGLKLKVDQKDNLTLDMLDNNTVRFYEISGGEPSTLTIDLTRGVIIE